MPPFPHVASSLVPVIFLRALRLIVLLAVTVTAGAVAQARAQCLEAPPIRAGVDLPTPQEVATGVDGTISFGFQRGLDVVITRLAHGAALLEPLVAAGA